MPRETLNDCSNWEWMDFKSIRSTNTSSVYHEDLCLGSRVNDPCSKPQATPLNSIVTVETPIVRKELHSDFPFPLLEKLGGGIVEVL